MAKTTYLVSTKFEGFCANEDVMTYDNFLSLVGMENNKVFPDCIVIGQGLDQRRIDYLAERMKQRGILDSIRIIWPDPHKADLHLIHKHNPDNAMITVPTQANDSRYIAALTLNDGCAEMSDHVTGQHIQGTVLLEAARQMMMASVEIHAFTPEQRGQYSYVLNELMINYFQYAFPIAIEIVLDIETCEFDEKGMLTARLSVSFYQINELVCQVRCNAQGYKKMLLSKLEARAAKLHLRQLRQQHIAISETGEHRRNCISNHDTQDLGQVCTPII
jgi:hypothetical protein